jgi:hypothetical protein
VAAAWQYPAGIPGATHSRAAALSLAVCEREVATALARAATAAWPVAAVRHGAWTRRALCHQAQEAVGYGRRSYSQVSPRLDSHELCAWPIDNSNVITPSQVYHSPSLLHLDQFLTAILRLLYAWPGTTD